MCGRNFPFSLLTRETLLDAMAKQEWRVFEAPGVELPICICCMCDKLLEQAKLFDLVESKTIKA
jgi:hypothetical protein